MRILLFIVTIAVIYSCAAQAQDVKVIPIKQVPVSYSPKSFYISDVTDSTADKTAIGTITDGGNKQKITLQDGSAAALKNFIDNNVKQDKATQAVVLNIRKLDVDIKKKGGMWAVSISASFAFYTGGLMLVEFSGKGHGETDAAPEGYVDNFIRQALKGDLSRFDEWWQVHKDAMPVSNSVKVNVTIGKTTDKPNLIVYSIQRPVHEDDFRAPVRYDVPEKAMTMSGNIFSATSEVQKGELVLDVALTPYFDKAESWFNPDGKNTSLLAHEQGHFDITAIKTCELAEAMRKATFTKEDYNGVLGQLRKQSQAASDEEQNAYDNETAHGTIPDKQQAWLERLAREARAVGCY